MVILLKCFDFVEGQVGPKKKNKTTENVYRHDRLTNMIIGHNII